MLLVSLPVAVIETLVPKDETKAGIVPISISPWSPSTLTSVTVLKTLVPVPTVLLPLTPLIWSVIKLPSWSVPVIVIVKAVLSSLSRFLIVIIELRDVLSLSAPSIVITPAPDGFVNSTIPLLSAAIEFKPLITRDVFAITDCEVDIASWSKSEVPLNLALILLFSGPSIITSPFFITPSYCWPSKDIPIVVPSGGRDVIMSPFIWDIGVPILNSFTSAFEIS